MKYIEKKYQDLINNIESAYDDTCDTLKYHINELKKMLAEKDEEIEKLKKDNKLQAEIDEYNRFEAEKKLSEEEKEVADKAAKLIARDYGETIKELGDE